MVADAKMVEKHGKGDVTTYILTVMNMVRALPEILSISQDASFLMWVEWHTLRHNLLLQILNFEKSLYL